MTSNPQPRAFTLVELTVVLALIGLTMGLVLVRFDWGSSRQRVISEAKRLAHAIATYRERAMNEECVYAFRIDKKENRWDVYRLDEKLALDLSRVHPVCTRICDASVRILAITSQSGVQYDSEATVYFDSRGVSSEVAMNLGVEWGAQIWLKIDPVVNDVKVVEH